MVKSTASRKDGMRHSFPKQHSGLRSRRIQPNGPNLFTFVHCTGAAGLYPKRATMTEALPLDCILRKVRRGALEVRLKERNGSCFSLGRGVPVCGISAHEPVPGPNILVQFSGCSLSPKLLRNWYCISLERDERIAGASGRIDSAVMDLHKQMGAGTTCTNAIEQRGEELDEHFHGGSQAQTEVTAQRKAEQAHALRVDASRVFACVTASFNAEAQVVRFIRTIWAPSCW